MSERISTAEARKKFARILRRSAQGELIKITRHDITVAGIISKGDLEEFERYKRELSARPSADHPMAYGADRKRMP